VLNLVLTIPNGQSLSVADEAAITSSLAAVLNTSESLIGVEVSGYSVSTTLQVDGVSAADWSNVSSVFLDTFASLLGANMTVTSVQDVDSSAGGRRHLSQSAPGVTLELQSSMSLSSSEASALAEALPSSVSNGSLASSLCASGLCELLPGQVSQPVTSAVVSTTIASSGADADAVNAAIASGEMGDALVNIAVNVASISSFASLMPPPPPPSFPLTTNEFITNDVGISSLRLSLKLGVFVYIFGMLFMY